MKKSILIILLFFTNFAFSFEISSKVIKNAGTVLIEVNKPNISDVKLTFDKQNIDFFKNPFKENYYYALLPISYYQKANEYNIVFSYLENGKKIFKSEQLKVIKGDYKSETLSVEPGKIKLSKENEERAKKEAAIATKIYRSKSDKILWSEDFIMPLDSHITSPFGTSRVYNGDLKSYHGGTDFRAMENTPIKATNSGIVKISKNRFYAGGTIVIDHGHGVYSCYFHLNKMNFKEGDFVKRGEIIGLSGSTGRVTGPHLHFTIRIDSLQVDPLQAIEVLNSLKF